jgi:hypothetical protein
MTKKKRYLRLKPCFGRDNAELLNVVRASDFQLHGFNVHGEEEEGVVAANGVDVKASLLIWNK